MSKRCFNNALSDKKTINNVLGLRHWHIIATVVASAQLGFYLTLVENRISTNLHHFHESLSQFFNFTTKIYQQHYILYVKLYTRIKVSNILFPIFFFNISSARILYKVLKVLAVHLSLIKKIG